uniref:Uncharacterized protein n=1 Tax=Hyaloperonospora arabidopsidis (strain Emoy2) TaxID=559515 RepID=M4B772_HYAAE
MAMCSLHSVWRNVCIKRLAKRWQRGPLVLQLLLLRKWQVARHFVRSTWSHICQRKAKQWTKKTTPSFSGCTALVASAVSYDQRPTAQSHALCFGYYGSRECWSECDHQPANPYH